MRKTTVIHHSADYDGIFCREIARKFLPDAELIGWDFGNAPRLLPEGQVYILDLPVDRVFGYDFTKGLPADFDEVKKDLVWIDHHKSAIETHPATIPGYRIDGVAACRLAWQWFTAEARLVEQGSVNRDQITTYPFPEKQDYADRKVSEPLAIQLAGEWDIWDHRDPRAELFQFGLDSVKEPDWARLLSTVGCSSDGECDKLCERGESAKAVIDKRNADVMRERSFLIDFEGLKFLACNFVRCNSKSFAERDRPETGHDALMSFWWDGKQWNVSMYHAEHRKEIDLSMIAVKHGGGGHRGACGFRADKLPFAN